MSIVHVDGSASLWVPGLYPSWLRRGRPARLYEGLTHRRPTLFGRDLIILAEKNPITEAALTLASAKNIDINITVSLATDFLQHPPNDSTSQSIPRPLLGRRRHADWTGLSFLVTLLLARLLAPEYFGLIGIATLAISSLVFFQELGFQRGADLSPGRRQSRGQYRSLDDHRQQSVAVRGGVRGGAAGCPLLPQPRGHACFAGAVVQHCDLEPEPGVVRAAVQGPDLPTKVMPDLIASIAGN